MNLKLKEILNDNNDSAVSIVTWNQVGAHLVNTWNSFVQIINDTTLHIPAGGFNETEKNLLKQPAIILSITSKVVQGFNNPGIGIVVEGLGKIITEGVALENMRTKFPWARAVLEVKVTKATQTM